MAGKSRDDVREEDVTGLKYFDKLAPLLARLHEVGCERDKAGNRHLHYDQYCMLVLLFLFNPVVRSLRAIEQASELRKVRRKLGCQRASLGSLSEATDVFRPERLKEIIAELVLCQESHDGWYHLGAWSGRPIFSTRRISWRSGIVLR